MNGRNLLVKMLDEANASIDEIERIVAPEVLVAQNETAPHPPRLLALTRINTLVNSYHRNSRRNFQLGVLDRLAQG